MKQFQYQCINVNNKMQQVLCVKRFLGMISVFICEGASWIASDVQMAEIDVHTSLCDQSLCDVK